MALATPQGHAAALPLLTHTPVVDVFVAPEYDVQERASDLTSAEGWALALVQSPYALAKLQDRRYLAAHVRPREARSRSLFLGFIDGPAATHHGSFKTLAPDGGSAELGVRRVAVESAANSGH
ncbi:MAG: hypothetical protein SGPRY_011112, partial [Prymnesium sp.]